MAAVLPFSHHGFSTSTDCDGENVGDEDENEENNVRIKHGPCNDGNYFSRSIGDGGGIRKNSSCNNCSTTNNPRIDTYYYQDHNGNKDQDVVVADQDVGNNKNNDQYLQDWENPNEVKSQRNVESLVNLSDRNNDNNDTDTDKAIDVSSSNKFTDDDDDFRNDSETHMINTSKKGVNDGENSTSSVMNGVSTELESFIASGIFVRDKFVEQTNQKQIDDENRCSLSFSSQSSSFSLSAMGPELTDDKIVEVPVDNDIDNNNQASRSYGGLTNLGNTCYMASAIQLLAGLDNFRDELESKIPPSLPVIDDKTDTISDSVDQPVSSLRSSSMEASNDNVNDYNNGNNINNNNQLHSSSQSHSPVRDALVDVFQRLSNGETFRPEDLKSIIDSKISLFEGYYQQDSHEFVTTLLDLIDEEYKPKPLPPPSLSPSPPPKVQKITITRTNSESEMELEPDKESDNIHFVINGNACAKSENNEIQKEIDGKKDMKDNNSTVEEGNVKNNHSGDEELESTLKKQKLKDDTDSINDISINANDENNNSIKSDTHAMIARSKSFSEFQNSDIENLLYQDNSKISVTKRSSTTALSSLDRDVEDEQPKYKLAGGRMSTSGIELTRYIDEEERFTNDENFGISDVTNKHNRTNLNSNGEGTTDTFMQLVGKKEDEKEEDDTSTRSPVSSFTTEVRVCLTCESCKFRRSHMETYLHLSLEIGSECSSIEDGLKKFFAPEQREIKCEKCFHTSAMQTSKITKLPRNLLFHLKRFIVDVSPDYTSISYRKDQSAVSFEERIQLGQQIEDDDTNYDYYDRIGHDDDGRLQDFLSVDATVPKGSAYEIRSIVNHIGSSASCGHYSADAKKHYDNKDNNDNDNNNSVDNHDDHNQDVDYIDCYNAESEPKRDEQHYYQHRQWTRFNDAYVSKISPQEAVHNNRFCAYMIMYELVEE